MFWDIFNSLQSFLFNGIGDSVSNLYSGLLTYLSWFAIFFSVLGLFRLVVRIIGG